MPATVTKLNRKVTVAFMTFIPEKSQAIHKRALETLCRKKDNTSSQAIKALIKLEIYKSCTTLVINSISPLLV
jgi:hypothetical protein